MGCGKSTLGAALAQCMHVPFVDLDDYIEQRCEATINEIFETVGESEFRNIERRCLEEVVMNSQGAIVACGGGTPCQPGNMELMNRHGITIWLTTGAHRIASRLVLPEQKGKRPTLATMDDSEILAHVERGIAQRKHHYGKAQLTFDSTLLESTEEINATAFQLSQLLQSL